MTCASEATSIRPQLTDVAARAGRLQATVVRTVALILAASKVRESAYRYLCSAKLAAAVWHLPGPARARTKSASRTVLRP
ncbi:hypothetical protein [Lentzea albida]|uniref:hypothetical protein n=1 Tax=Lentzea albida TaxID=65499 RepID=UPI001C430763|nr:hypothetical protein [Lentzea albida]